MIKELGVYWGFSCSPGNEGKGSSNWRGMESTEVSVLKNCYFM